MTEKRLYKKRTCCISGCTRWSRQHPNDWICGRHWRTIRKSRRVALRKFWRIMSAEVEAFENNPALATGDRLKTYRRIYFRELKLWRAAVREATIKAAGL